MKKNAQTFQSHAESLYVKYEVGNNVPIFKSCLSFTLDPLIGSIAVDL